MTEKLLISHENEPDIVAKIRAFLLERNLQCPATYFENQIEVNLESTNLTETEANDLAAEIGEKFEVGFSYLPSEKKIAIRIANPN
jgi:hypothetical protein